MTAAIQKLEFHPTVTAMQVWERLPEGIHAEVIDNRLYILTFPTLYHQDVLATLYRNIYDFVLKHDLGKIWLAPVGVFLENDKDTVVGPDIVFVSRGNSIRIERRGLFGVPDFLIEILSPGTKSHDFNRKKHLYERTGVKEYWLVDPETKKTTGYLLENDSYGKPLLLNSEINIRILNKSIKF